MATCSCCGQAPEWGSVHLHSRRDVEICYRCLDRLSTQRREKAGATGEGARIAGVEPIFTVTDVERAVDHYQRLGFSTSEHDQTYAFAHRDDPTIHLAQADGPGAAPVGMLYLHVDDAEQLADDWRKAGVAVVGPEDYGYGKREGSHTDPDGNLIRFGSPLAPG
jgi:predicted enzyme related to lactoylglutathione lyase